MINRQALFVLMFLVSFVFVTGIVFAAEPYGVSSVTEEASSFGNGSASVPSSHGAIAGNVTEITVDGKSITRAWQGYYGNVTGTIQLADSSDNIMYNWTSSSLTAQGEIYASTNDSIQWSSVQCFNFTANGSVQINLTTLESSFNIGASDGDGVDETFALNNHASFNLSTTEFTTGQCNNTKVFGPSGALTFDEALLVDTSKNATVFVSILDDDTTGFDNNAHDFEMLVLEDGHSGESTTTDYYFYVDLG